MGVRNPEVLYVDGCRHLNAETQEFCGRQQDVSIHGPYGDHEYEE